MVGCWFLHGRPLESTLTFHLFRLGGVGRVSGLHEEGKLTKFEAILDLFPYTVLLAWRSEMTRKLFLDRWQGVSTHPRYVCWIPNRPCTAVLLIEEIETLALFSSSVTEPGMCWFSIAKSKVDISVIKGSWGVKMAMTKVCLAFVWN